MKSTGHEGRDLATSNPIRILIAEPHSLVCQGLRGIVNQVPGYSIVGETGDGAAVVELVAQLEPELVFLSVGFAGASGLELLLALRHTKRRVIMLADGDDDKTLRQALSRGAAGYLLRSVTAAELRLAIRTVLHGYRYLSVELSDRIIGQYAASPAAVAVPALSAKFDEIPLTHRQREVLQLLASGHDNNQIGSRLGISPRTVEGHRAGIMQKLGLTTPYAAVRYALQRGLISLDEGGGG